MYVGGRLDLQVLGVGKGQPGAQVGRGPILVNPKVYDRDTEQSSCGHSVLEEPNVCVAVHPK